MQPHLGLLVVWLAVCAAGWFQINSDIDCTVPSPEPDLTFTGEIFGCVEFNFIITNKSKNGEHMF